MCFFWPAVCATQWKEPSWFGSLFWCLEIPSPSSVDLAHALWLLACFCTTKLEAMNRKNVTSWWSIAVALRSLAMATYANYSEKFLVLPSIGKAVFTKGAVNICYTLWYLCLVRSCCFLLERIFISVMCSSYGCYIPKRQLFYMYWAGGSLFDADVSLSPVWSKSSISA